MVHRDDEVTVRPTPPTPPGGSRTPTPGRFAPGSIIAGRYRLVALLGRGGMGEVYRADDLTLDQPVALKFLSASDAATTATGDDERRLAQFHNELRVARQVSHKNVCRLYDVGEADGRRFLTMEYVDGEDLGTLLRRIGRFPQDRAITIARQLCAGISAAHERGVIHRDLKPANVMIDGEGNVRITDFGIATAAAADAGGGLAGTPQYMAPEQLAGQPASTKSDIYALGLILFEIFTGRRAHDAKTMGALKALHDTGTVTTPSSIVRDLDPGVERVVLRCLNRHPDERPASALAVAAALPGGDPLAAALAAGETPSPEILAAAAETGALPVLHGLALIGVLLVSLASYAALSPLSTMADLVPLEKAPAVLADRAHQILTEFGYDDAPADSANNFTISQDFPSWLVATDQTSNRWNPSRVAMGPALLFWHRTSPRDLDPQRPAATVTPTDPPMTITGMSLVILDTRGRLWEFHRVPPQRDSPREAPPAARWDAAFQAAGLAQAEFTAVAPEWTPRDFADTRQAWEGPLPDHPDVRVRVEAAAYRGRLVSFHLVGPWTRASRMEPPTQSGKSRALRTFSVLLWLAILMGAVLLARHNLRANRADRRSAARLAVVYLALQVAAWAIGGHHLSAIADEAQLFFKMLGVSIFPAGTLWLLYLALEPYGRRFWPDGLLGWTRLFSGRVRDPRIGREILIGSALGGGLMFVDLFRPLSPLLVGRPLGFPSLGGDVAALNGFGQLSMSWTGQFFNSVQSTLIIVMLFIVLRLVVRRTWIAVVVGLAVVTAAAGGGAAPGSVPWLYYAGQVLAIGLITVSIFRYGLLVTTVALIVDNIPSAVPIVPHGPSWAALPGNLSMALVFALACFGFYAARAGQPLFGDFSPPG